jgi:hypothetical protein
MMRRFPRFLFVVMFAASGVLFGQEEETSEAPPEQEKTLEWNGNLDVKYTVFHMHESAAAYSLQFPVNKPSSSFLTQYRLEPYLNAEYRTRDLSFTLRTHALYLSDADAAVDLFEAYGSYNPSFNMTVQAGKRVYTWGKGYAFNPVGYVNPLKDPENPELAQAGLLSANVEYVKSFASGTVQNLSFLLVIIPFSATTETRFGELKHTDLALKTSLLIWDTDIDLMGYYSIQKPRRLGFDIARNLSENMEVHAELSYSYNAEKLSVANNTVSASLSKGMTYLLGFRYLHGSNTTLIAEYYHNELGASASEFDAYNRFLTLGIQGNDPVLLQQAAAVSQRYVRGSNVMKDYVYLKLTRPEPFDWLYFTPSLFIIYNVADKSLLCSATMNYKPATNIEFILWPTLVTGGENTEYGSKAFRQKVEVWMRVFF